MIANFCRNVDRFYSSFGELNYAAIGQNLSTKTSLCNYTTSFKNELDFVKYKHLYDHSIGDDKKSLKKKNKEKKIGAYTPVPRSRRNFIWKQQKGPEGWAIKKIKTPEEIYKPKPLKKEKKVKENKKRANKKAKNKKIKKLKLEKLKSTKSVKNYKNKIENLNNKEKKSTSKNFSNAKKNITDILRNEINHGVNISIDDTINRFNDLISISNLNYTKKNTSPFSKTDCNYLTKRNKQMILNNDFSMDIHQEKKKLNKKHKSSIEYESDSKSEMFKFKKEHKPEKTESSKSITLNNKNPKYTISSVKPIKNRNFSDRPQTLMLYNNRKSKFRFEKKKNLAATEKNIYMKYTPHINLEASYFNEENTISIGQNDSSILSPLENYINPDEILPMNTSLGVHNTSLNISKNQNPKKKLKVETNTREIVNDNKASLRQVKKNDSYSMQNLLKDEGKANTRNECFSERKVSNAAKKINNDDLRSRITNLTQFA